MCSHLLNKFRYELLIIPAVFGFSAITCEAQMMWQMVHEDERREVVQRDAEGESDAQKDNIVSVKAVEYNSSRPNQINADRGWRKDITATIFWVGEKACRANPVHNKSSSWDMRWVSSFGGVDHPYRRKGFQPKYFQPKMNPFYVALPYNDIASKTNKHKSEASTLIWWYGQAFRNKYLSVCKGKWLAIKCGQKICYAQWEDCGPFLTNDWAYVFKGQRPKTNKNNSAGIDLSPAIRDFLELKSGDKVSWKFVEEAEIERGPWSKWTTKSSFLTTNP